jgi:hypothetical protein
MISVFRRLPSGEGSLLLRMVISELPQDAVKVEIEQMEVPIMGVSTTSTGRFRPLDAMVLSLERDDGNGAVLRNEQQHTGYTVYLCPEWGPLIVPEHWLDRNLFLTSEFGIDHFQDLKSAESFVSLIGLSFWQWSVYARETDGHACITGTCLRENKRVPLTRILEEAHLVMSFDTFSEAEQYIFLHSLINAAEVAAFAA